MLAVTENKIPKCKDILSLNVTYSYNPKMCWDYNSNIKSGRKAK